jgi:hypothetical protein
MPYTIDVADLAFEELLAIKAFYRNRIINRIDEQLLHEPTVETRNRKALSGFSPDFEHGDPVWELRVGDYRV